MPRLAGRLALVGFGTLVGVLLAEGAVRLLDPLGISYFRHFRRYQSEALRASPLDGVGYEHVPSRVLRAGAEYRFDALGLRGGGVEVPKSRGATRIVALGDSVTLGWGVAEEETFCVRLARALTARRGTEVEAVNTGVVGYGTTQEERWFDGRGRALEPDLVLLVACSNDALPPTEGVPGPAAASGPRPAALADLVSRLDWWILTRPTRLDVFRLLRFWTLVRHLNPPPADDDEATERYRSRIDRLRAVLAAGAPTIDPTASLAAADRLREACGHLGVPLVVLPFDPVPWLEAWCEERGVPCLPPVPDVAADRSLHVSRMDSHPNGEGHARIAAHLLAGLDRLGLP